MQSAGEGGWSWGGIYCASDGNSIYTTGLLPAQAHQPKSSIFGEEIWLMHSVQPCQKWTAGSKLLRVASGYRISLNPRWIYSNCQNRFPILLNCGACEMLKMLALWGQVKIASFKISANSLQVLIYIALVAYGSEHIIPMFLLYEY